MSNHNSRGAATYTTTTATPHRHANPPPPPPESWRQRFYRLFVLLVYIYPIYFVRRLASWYTARQYQRRQKQRCKAILSSTEDYQTWKQVASTLDNFEGYEQWRNQINEHDTSDYNEPKLKESAELVERLSATHCDAAMGTYLRTSLRRGLYGLGCHALHRYYVGSKKTVEDYLSAVEKMILKFSSPPALGREQRAGGDGGDDNEENASSNSSSASSAPTTTTGAAEDINQVNSPNAEGAFPPIPSSVSPAATASLDDDDDDDDDDEHGGFSLRAGRDTQPDQAAPPQHLDLLHWATRDNMANERELRNKKAASITRQERHGGDDADDDEQQQQQERRFHFLPSRSSTLSTKEKFHILKNAAQAYGRTALMLSGGGSLGMYHAGVIRALWSAKLLPKIVSGSSAGAILGSIFCTRTDDEIDALLQSAEGLEQHVNLDPFDSYDDVLNAVSTRVWRLIRTGAFMDVEVLMKMMRKNVGDATFAEAYHRTGRILNIAIASVSREGGKDAKSLTLNYVSAPHVMIWTAVAASCAYPRLFTAVQLLQKNPVTGSVQPFLPGQRWSDGSITADLPFDCLAELFNVSFFIVSQVNPHVAPFVRPSLNHIVHKRGNWLLRSLGSLWLGACEEARYWLLKCFRSGLIQATGENEILFLQLSQKYSGDVTIRPIRSFWSALPDYINLTSNPTKELLEYVTGTGQRRTWPHIGMLESNMRIELAMQHALNTLQKQLVASETDLVTSPLM